MPEQDLTNKRALITGGTRGIGAASARALAERGAQVVICGRNAPTQPVPDVQFIAADLSSTTGPEQLAAATLETLGGLDILINNAGGQITHTTVEEFSDEDWHQELQIHLLASVKLDRALLPALSESTGSIVHVSSAVARLPEPAVIAYATAKAALAVYSKGLSKQVGPHGVRVNTILPGFTATEMMTERVHAMAQEHGQTDENFLPSLMQQMGVSLQRAASPQEIADVIAFLVSPASSYITGTQTMIDGGVFPSVF